MDKYFLDYCYQVSAYTCDYLREVKRIKESVPPEDVDFHIENEKVSFNERVEMASKKFNKGVALWGYLYDGKPLVDESLAQ